VSLSLSRVKAPTRTLVSRGATNSVAQGSPRCSAVSQEAEDDDDHVSSSDRVSQQALDAALAKLSPEAAEFTRRGVELCRPSAIHVVDGSDEENAWLLGELVKAGTLTKLSDAKRPG
jgi:hypothetical protein